MDCDQDEYNYVGPNFVIENNILKGESVDHEFSVNGVGEVILNQMSSSPDHVAQIDADTEETTTFGEMKDNMIRCAIWLQKQGVGKGDVVTVCTHNHLDAYIPCFATFLVGAIFNPWHHELSLIMARYFINLTHPKVVFVSESAYETLSEAARLENLDPMFVIFGKDPEPNSLQNILDLQTAEEVDEFEPVPAKDACDIACILFSSGSTGLPKGVAHSYNMLLQVIYGPPLMPVDGLVVLWYSSLYWISGTLLMVQSLMRSATRIVHGDCDPEETSQIIEKFKVQTFFLPIAKLQYFCKSGVFQKYSYESVDSILTGGSRLSSEVLQCLQDNVPHGAIVQAFGMTETGPVCARSNECETIDSVGFILPNTQIKVVDVESGKSLGPNQSGECCSKSPFLMIGYYKNQEATDSMFDEEGWTHTGDLVYYTEKGEIFVVDRLKEVMKFRGHHVSPSELEAILASHPGVMEAAVVPVPHDMDLERPMAFVKKAPEIEVTAEELIEMTAELGELKKLWGGVQFLEEMPYTSSGKLSRKDLKEMAKSFENCGIED